MASARAFALAGEGFEQFVGQALVVGLGMDQLQILGRVAQAMMELGEQVLLLVLDGEHFAVAGLEFLQVVLAQHLQAQGQREVGLGFFCVMASI